MGNFDFKLNGHENNFCSYTLFFLTVCDSIHSKKTVTIAEEYFYGRSLYVAKSNL